MINYFLGRFDKNKYLLAFFDNTCDYKKDRVDGSSSANDKYHCVFKKLHRQNKIRYIHGIISPVSIIKEDAVKDISPEIFEKRQNRKKGNYYYKIYYRKPSNDHSISCHCQKW